LLVIGKRLREPTISRPAAGTFGTVNLSRVSADSLDEN
jgi:hypothetical protein